MSFAGCTLQTGNVASATLFAEPICRGARRRGRRAQWPRAAASGSVRSPALRSRLHLAMPHASQRTTPALCPVARARALLMLLVHPHPVCDALANDAAGHSLRRASWLNRTAIVVGDVYDEQTGALISVAVLRRLRSCRTTGRRATHAGTTAALHSACSDCAACRGGLHGQGCVRAGVLHLPFVLSRCAQAGLRRPRAGRLGHWRLSAVANDAGRGLYRDTAPAPASLRHPRREQQGRGGHGAA